MILHLVLTLIILLVFFLIGQWAAGAPFANPNVKWCIQGIIVLICVVAILGVWGLLGPVNGLG